MQDDDYEENNNPAPTDSMSAPLPSVAPVAPPPAQMPPLPPNVLTHITEFINPFDYNDQGLSDLVEGFGISRYVNQQGSRREYSPSFTRMLYTLRGMSPNARQQLRAGPITGLSLATMRIRPYPQTRKRKREGFTLSPPLMHGYINVEDLTAPNRNPRGTRIELNREIELQVIDELSNSRLTSQSNYLYVHRLSVPYNKFLRRQRKDRFPHGYLVDSKGPVGLPALGVSFESLNNLSDAFVNALHDWIEFYVLPQTCREAGVGLLEYLPRPDQDGPGGQPPAIM